MYQIRNIYHFKYSKETQPAQRTDKRVAEAPVILTVLCQVQLSLKSFTFDRHTVHNVVNILSLMV